MTFNAGLAHQVMDMINLRPDRHVQSDWRCGTGMCFAGWVAEINELEWASQTADGTYGAYVVVKKEDYDEVPTHNDSLAGVLSQTREAFAGCNGESPYSPIVTTSAGRDIRDIGDDEMVLHVADYAKQVLGLTQDEARQLFGGGNHREQLALYIKAFESGDPDLVMEARQWWDTHQYRDGEIVNLADYNREHPDDDEWEDNE